MRNADVIFLVLGISTIYYMRGMEKAQEQPKENSVIVSLRRKLSEGLTTEDVDRLEKTMRKDDEMRSTKAEFKYYSICLEPTMPMKPAVIYCSKLRKTIKGNPIEFIQDHAKQDDPKAPQAELLQRYFKIIISKAFSLRVPELKENQVGDELKQAINSVHNNLHDLTYIAIGNNNSLVKPEQWNEYWEAVQKALNDDIPMAIAL